MHLDSSTYHYPMPSPASHSTWTQVVWASGRGGYSSRVEMKMKLHDMEVRSNDDLIMSKTSGISFYH